MRPVKTCRVVGCKLCGQRWIFTHDYVSHFEAKPALPTDHTCFPTITDGLPIPPETQGIVEVLSHPWYLYGD